MYMRKAIWAVLGVLVLVFACESPKPAPTGRLSGPVDLAVVKGCPQKVPGCDKTDPAASKHLLLVTDSLDDAVRVFDVEDRRFFSAPDPLFAFSIRVGRYPRSLAVDPFQEFAFVVNGISDDVSVIDLALDRMVEVDTDWDSCSSFCGSCWDENGDPAWGDQPIDDRCRAGVSRVELGNGQDVQPDDIVAPVAREGDWDGPWDRTAPLPVYVSLSGSGQIARMQFFYPGFGPNYAQRMDLTDMLEVGGRPAGMAITSDGSQVFAADEASDSIIAINTDDLTFERIDIGGPSRSLTLTPDESTLYVVRTDDGVINLVDVASHALVPAGDAPFNARDPEGGPTEIRLPSIPRAVAFTQGVSERVYDETGLGAIDYTKELLSSAELSDILEVNTDYEETVVKTFAFVSDMNGYVYLLDAENNRPVDVYPNIGPSVTAMPGLAFGDETVDQDTLVGCATSTDHDNGNCPYPSLAGFDYHYTTPVDEEGNTLTCYEESDTTPYKQGKIELDDDNVPICVCDDGYHALGRYCLVDGKNEILRNYYGIYVRPGVTRSEGWIFTWEGALPGTEHSTSGSLSNWSLQDDRAGIDFVGADVQPGDILQILSDPGGTGGAGDDPCRAGSGDSESENPQKEYTVSAVDTNMLEITPVDGIDLAACWPDAVRYQVRVKNAWTVFGTSSGTMPRLTNVPYQQEAPYPPAYDNGMIALTMFAPGTDQDNSPVSIPRDSTWGFNTDSGFSTYSFIATSLYGGVAGSLVPVDIDDDDPESDSYQIDDRLYMVFEGSNAMLEFFPGNLDPNNFLLYQ